jgi:hypothetical protein
VDYPEVEALLTPETLRLLEETPTPTSNDDVLATVSRLRKASHPIERVHAVMNQLSLRTKAQEKFGDFAPRMLFTKEGLEQATRLDVASHHAGRFRAAGITSLIDAGCGIGADSLAFAGLGIQVTAIERDTATAALASYNLAPFPDVTVINADVRESDLSGGQALWIDPARREGATRLHNPEDWSPSLDWVFEMAAQRPTGIKLAPGMDRDLIPEGIEAQWVSHHGSVVEMVLWSGALKREGVTRSALVISRGGTAEMVAGADSPDAELGNLEEYLYEPDGAIIRARLIGDLARSLDATMIDESIAYFSSATPHQSPLMQGFQIIDRVPYSPKNVNALIARANLSDLEIKKRGIDIDPAELRKTLPLSGSGTATLILTRIKGQKTALLTKRLGSVGQDVSGADEERKDNGQGNED